MAGTRNQRRLWRSALGVWLALFGASVFAQEIEQLKHGVVRVLIRTQAGVAKTGTGFIVKLAQDLIHIVTATHVVQGAEKIEVEFFSKREAPVPANVGKMEDDSLRGIAYLVVRAPAPPGTQVLSLAPQLKLTEGSDEVLTIGFPQGAPGWSPKSLKFATRDGRELMFDGKVNEGNSGGPLLKDGQVVALVQSERNGYVRANPAAAVLEFLEGSGLTLGSGSTSPPPDTEALEKTLGDPTKLARVSITDVVCDKEPDFVGIIATGEAGGPVGAIVQADFDDKGSFFDIALECGVWSRWRYGVACVRTENAPEITLWRAKAKLSAIPRTARAEIGEPVTADDIKPLARDQCRIDSCDKKKVVCAPRAEVSAEAVPREPSSSARSPAISAPGIPAPPESSEPPGKNDVAALSPRFSWGETVKRSGLLVLSTRGQLWLAAVGGAERNPVYNGAALAITGNEYVVTSSLHSHRLPVRITVRTDKILSGEFMKICEATNPCVPAEAVPSEAQFRDNMQTFFLEVAKAALRRMSNP